MGYCGRTDPAVVYARLSAAPRGLCADAGAAQVPITRALVAALGSLVEQITMLSDQIGQQLEALIEPKFRIVADTVAIASIAASPNSWM